MKKRKPKRINPVARALRSRALKQRVVRARKGRGAYNRKAKNAAQVSGGVNTSAGSVGDYCSAVLTQK